MTKAARESGFTLIEVMVALAIFAVLSVTLLVRMGDNIRAEEYLQTKTLAALLAENTLVELRLKKKWSALSNKTDTVEFAGQSWNLSVKVSDTSNEHLRKVEVQVGPDLEWQSNDSYVFTLTSYIGEY
jgi:general secretion pathway protein I